MDNNNDNHHATTTSPPTTPTTVVNGNSNGTVMSTGSPPSGRREEGEEEEKQEEKNEKRSKYIFGRRKGGLVKGGGGGSRRGGDGRAADGFLARLWRFFRQTWIDWCTLAAVGILTAGLWTIHSTRARYFPVTFTTSGDIVYPSLAYPYVPAVFSALAAGLLSALIPVAVILLCQIYPRIRSFEDATSGILGLAYSLVTGNFFQVVLKKSIGGYRPHFLSVCQPVIPENAAGGSGFNSVMYLSDICTGSPSKIQNAMESFPSGHSQIAFAGLLYLAIYLNAHLRVFSFSATYTTRRPRHWKMLAVVAPVLLATYLASTLVLGHHHHWYDVLFGSLIGSVMAVWGYKMVFVSVWDGKTNCQPLRRDRIDETGGLRANADNGVLPTTRQDAEARV